MEKGIWEGHHGGAWRKHHLGPQPDQKNHSPSPQSSTLPCPSCVPLNGDHPQLAAKTPLTSHMRGSPRKTGKTLEGKRTHARKTRQKGPSSAP